MRLTPQSTAPGNTDVGLSGDLLVVDRGFGPQYFFSPELQIRRGLADDIDLGVRITPGGAVANSRFRLLDSDRFDLTAVLGVGLGFTAATNRDTSIFHFTPQMGVVAGYTFGDLQVVAGLHALYEFRFGLLAFSGNFDDARWVPVPGATIGIEFPWGAPSDPTKPGLWAVFAEFGAFFPVERGAPAILQTGLGFRTP